MDNMHVDTLSTTGAPLLFIHGWGMHGGMWGGALERLAQRYRVMAVDLPGHGYSKIDVSLGGNGKSLDSPMDSIVTALSAQFAGPLTVCGWSLGGQIAMQWALRHPEQVQRLALVSSTPCFVQTEDWSCAMEAETLALFSSALQKNYAQTLRRFLALQVRGSDQEREMLTLLRDRLMSRGEPNLDALQSGLEILRDLDLRVDLAGIRQPTLVMAGERDTLTPLPASKYMAEQIPDARLAVINGAAHAPFLSHADEFVEKLMDFLDE